MSWRIYVFSGIAGFKKINVKQNFRLKKLGNK